MDKPNAVFCDMPGAIKGFTILKDGTYTVCLNSNLNFEQNAMTYAHELKHIENGDFEKKTPADIIEIYAHK